MVALQCCKSAILTNKKSRTTIQILSKYFFPRDQISSRAKMLEFLNIIKDFGEKNYYIAMGVENI